MVAAVAVGGAIGAGARYAVALALPTPVGGFPWATLLTNVSGCALMGVLMVTVTELLRAHPLVRPLLGTGVLGGYTTFSTFVGDFDSLAAAGHPIPALLYLISTPVAALIALWTAASLTRRLGRTAAGP
ncbi:fluoride efflux transporter FluC [Mycolicibacter minnesotensis]